MVDMVIVGTHTKHYATIFRHGFQCAAKQRLLDRIERWKASWCARLGRHCDFDVHFLLARRLNEGCAFVNQEDGLVIRQEHICKISLANLLLAD